jgi:hypothetical protein
MHTYSSPARAEEQLPRNGGPELLSRIGGDHRRVQRSADREHRYLTYACPPSASTRKAPDSVALGEAIVELSRAGIA